MNDTRFIDLITSLSFQVGNSFSSHSIRVTEHLSEAQRGLQGASGSIFRRVPVNVPLPAKTVCPPRFTN
jgi:hypothetical protein